MYICAALYKFAEFNDLKRFREPPYQCMVQNEVKGTLLLAREGINRTLCGTREGIDAALASIRTHPVFANIEHTESPSGKQAFCRTKVKLKKEIVTMGIDWVDPKNIVGTYVEPKDWNSLIRDPEVVLIDTRNDYEYAVGTFEGAINP